MKKALLMLLILAAFTFAGSMREAMQELEEASKTALLIGSLVQFVIAALFLGGAAFLFLKKLKGVEKKETLWILIVLALGIIGVFLLMGAIMGFVTYLLVPSITQSMYY